MMLHHNSNVMKRDKMDKLELVIKGVSVEYLYTLLKGMNVLNIKNIQYSHFYVEDKDIEYSDEIDFKTYYTKKNTGMIVTKSANIGVKVNNVATVISGCNHKVEVTVNFFASFKREIYQHI